MSTILIVEAVAAHRELLGYLLKDDYTVLTAADGASGIALAEQREPDLIFMALTLPDMTGGEAIRQIKTYGRLYDIPIIALTDQATPDGEARARVVGCEEVFYTPPEEERLEATLRKWIGGG